MNKGFFLNVNYCWQKVCREKYVLKASNILFVFSLIVFEERINNNSPKFFDIFWFIQSLKFLNLFELHLLLVAVAENFFIQTKVFPIKICFVWKFQLIYSWKWVKISWKKSQRKREICFCLDFKYLNINDSFWKFK